MKKQKFPTIDENAEETPSYRPRELRPLKPPFIAEDDGGRVNWDDPKISERERHFQSLSDDRREAKIRELITSANPNWANSQNLHDKSDNWDWWRREKPESKSRLRSQGNSASQDEQRPKFRKFSHSRDVDIEPKSQQRNVQSNPASSSGSQQNRGLNEKPSRDVDIGHIGPTEHPIPTEAPVDQSLLDRILRTDPTEGEIQNRILGGAISVVEDPARRAVVGAAVGMNGKGPDHQNHHHPISNHIDQT